MTATEERAVEQAVPAWIAALHSLNSPEGTHRRGSDAKFQGPTADDILRANGIRFDDDRVRYGRLETEIRLRAKATLGV